jgi:hypothetical protein
MPISAEIRAVFGRFQNLNLLALLHDLRGGRTALHAWSVGEFLCPVAHGLPGGSDVKNLAVLGQTTDLGHGCDYAARQLGADTTAVLRFVRSWDEQMLSRDELLRQLQEMWEERLADAQTMQQFLIEASMVRQARPELLGHPGSP